MFEKFLNVFFISGLWLPYGLLRIGMFPEEDNDCCKCQMLAMTGALINVVIIVVAILIYLWTTGVK